LTSGRQCSARPRSGPGWHSWRPCSWRCPTIREEGLSGPTVALVIAWIALADAVTALLMPLMLTSAGQIPAALLGDALIILAAALTIALGRR
jgi:hypothetical protein